MAMWRKIQKSRFTKEKIHIAKYAINTPIS